MQKYDHMVVGGGISGLTLSLLLGLTGRHVLLLEKGPRPGGSMLRFRRRGVPFDTGFHFTGGFTGNGLLTQMLQVLGIADAVVMDPIQQACDNCFIFEHSGNTYEQPIGYEAVQERLTEYFPEDREGIRRCFEMMENVCRNTAAMELNTIMRGDWTLPEEDLTLAEVLDRCISNPELKMLLAVYTVCHGTPPDEISFANHSRVAYGLYHSLTRVVGGGQTFVDALCKALSMVRVEIRCNTALEACGDVDHSRIRHFTLSSGETVEADSCFFTIHPHRILDVLPRGGLHKAFGDRVRAFEPSIGFFSVYGVVHEGPGIRPFSPAIISCLPDADIDHLMRPGGRADRALVVMKQREAVNGRTENVVTIHEVSTPDDVAAWTESVTGRRPASYAAYKETCTERIRQRVLRQFPEYADTLEILSSASMLTFRDYLHSPWGCAYGIKQKLGQFNLFGRLPIRNLYAAGQSALLPGLVGAMMSSFMVMRSVVGREPYRQFIDRRLKPMVPSAEKNK